MEAFIDFFQRLSLELNIMISGSDDRKIIIETVAFENVNAQCTEISTHLGVVTGANLMWWV